MDRVGIFELMIDTFDVVLLSFEGLYGFVEKDGDLLPSDEFVAVIVLGSFGLRGGEND